MGNNPQTGVAMELIKLLEHLDDFDDNATIYVQMNREIMPNSEAIAVMELPDGRVPSATSNMSYFLEISLAKEIVKVWSNWRNGRLPSAVEKYNALVYYAENDTFLPV